ncbi:MAG: hypothetical protein II417_03915 [Elusimicrobia bacterium]|nr:hypothetical protein [Elusimicrobiota bacterium]
MAEEIKDVKEGADVQTEPTVDTKTEPKNDDVQTKAETTTGDKSDTNAEPKTEPKNETETKSEPNSEPEPKVEPKEIEYNFKFPDEIKVVDTEVAKLKELSKELKLSNEQAQKFVDFTVSQVKFFGKKAEQDFKTMRADWLKQTKETYTEEQIGNEGKVAREVGGQKFMELLETTGLADNPLVVGFLEKISVNYRNDKTVVGKPNGGEPTREQILDIMYPNTK